MACLELQMVGLTENIVTPSIQNRKPINARDSVLELLNLCMRKAFRSMQDDMKLELTLVKGKEEYECT